MNAARALKTGIASCVDVLNCRAGMGTRRGGFRVLLYHSVGLRRRGDTLGLTVPGDDFKMQVRSLKERDARVARLEGLVDAVTDKKGNCGGFLAVAFDDGYKDNFTHAAGILSELNVPATFFVRAGVLSGLASGDRYWDRWEYMSAHDVKRLALNPLFDIGSHGISHVKLTRLRDAQLYAEIRDSKDMLENAIGRAVSLFSYPYGCLDERVKCAVARAGYKAAFTSFCGANTCASDRFGLRRIEISGFDSMRVFERKARGSYDWVGTVQKLTGYR